MLTEVTATPGDLIIHMESPQFCLFSAIIRNGTASSRTLDDVCGYPLKAGSDGADYKLAVAGDEASVTALLVQGPNGRDSEVIAATTNSAKKWTVLKNPPAIINKSKIRTTDIAGASFNIANIVTALRALKFEVREESDKEETLA